MASVFDGMPALHGPPDIGNPLQMLFEGLTERRARQKEDEQELLGKSIGGKLATGDNQGAAATAFQGGDIGTGLKLQELSREQQTQFAQTLAKTAASITDEASWEPFRQRVTSLTGEDPGDFATGRQEIINEASSLDDILGRQGEAAESGAKAPDVVEIFDEATGQPQKMTWDAEVRKFVPLGGVKANTKSNGVQVITHPDGTTETIVGGSGGPLGKRAEGDVQLRAINASEMAGRIANTMAGFKPEFLTYGTRFQNMWRGVKAKVDPSSLSPGDEQALSEFASWKATAFDNLSTTLKEMSGAAVTPQEFERLKQSLPNPGTGIFDGDDPVTFQSKMDNVMLLSQAALARYQYYQTVGIPGSLDEIPLSNVKQIEGKWYVRAVDGQVYPVGGAAP